MALRRSLAAGTADVSIEPLDLGGLADIAWSGSGTHLEDVADQLRRADRDEVVYLVVRADGHAVAKGGIDFARDAGTGNIWQLVTHPDLEGLGLATRLVEALERRGRERGVHRFRMGVEPDNHRARRLYEHLGYRVIGESTASWDAETADGVRYRRTTTLVELEKRD